MYPPLNLSNGHPGQAPLNFCPNCGSRLTPIGERATAPGAPTVPRMPNFCANCGYQLTQAPPPGSFAMPPAYGLDTLIEATVVAKATLDSSRGADDVDERMNVTLMGVSRTLMGASRTLMGVPQSEINPWGTFTPPSGQSIPRDREAPWHPESDPDFLRLTHRERGYEASRVPLPVGLFFILAALIALVVAIFAMVNR